MPAEQSVTFSISFHKFLFNSQQICQYQSQHYFLHISPISSQQLIIASVTQKIITQVRLLQLQWNSRGGLAGASMELALPDTARLLRWASPLHMRNIFHLAQSFSILADPCNEMLIVTLVP